MARRQAKRQQIPLPFSEPSTKAAEPQSIELSQEGAVAVGRTRALARGFDVAAYAASAQKFASEGSVVHDLLGRLAGDVSDLVKELDRVPVDDDPEPIDAHRAVQALISAITDLDPHLVRAPAPMRASSALVLGALRKIAEAGELRSADGIPADEPATIEPGPGVLQAHASPDGFHIDLRHRAPGGTVAGWVLHARPDDARRVLTLRLALEGGLAATPTIGHAEGWLGLEKAAEVALPFPIAGGGAVRTLGLEFEPGLCTPDMREVFLTGAGALAGVLRLEKQASWVAHLTGHEIAKGAAWLAKLDESLVPSVLRGFDAPMPADGFAAMPRSLMEATPDELKFWLAKGDEARALRDELIEAEVFTDATIKIVDGTPRRVVTKVFLYDPEEAEVVERARWPRDFVPALAKVCEFDKAADIKIPEGADEFVLSAPDTLENLAALSSCGRVFRLKRRIGVGKLFVAAPLLRRDAIEFIPEAEIAKARAELSKPFGQWASFDACLADMRMRYDEETARKVCGALQRDLGEKAANPWYYDGRRKLWVNRETGQTQSERPEFGFLRGKEAADLSTGDLAQAGGLRPAQGKKPKRPEECPPGMTKAEEVALDDRTARALGADLTMRKFQFQKFIAQPPVPADMLLDERERDMTGEERYVLGVVLEPETVDSQGDIYSADEIRRAAFRWMEFFGRRGFMHEQLVDDRVRVLESYIAPVDFGEGENVVKAGSWLLGTRVLDDGMWRDIKAGRLQSYSIGGSAIRRPEKRAP